MTAPQAGDLVLSHLVHRTVVGPDEGAVGRLNDVVVRLRGNDQPLVVGLVADVGRRQVFVPAVQVRSWESDRLRLASATLDVRPFVRRPGEVLLRADVLGHRLVDISHATLVRAHDLLLQQTQTGWVLAGVRTTRTRRRGAAPDATFRDWQAFEALIGHEPTVLIRAGFGRLRSLRAAELADLLEDASRDEQAEILALVRQDPELEADVYEELDEHRGHLLAARPDTEVARLLARMHTDDAADAVMDLPASRRADVLALLPVGTREAVTNLLSYNQTTAGGLMSIEYLAVPADLTADAALGIIRSARHTPLEAAGTVHLLDDAGHLSGTVPLLRLVQADSSEPLAELADLDPVRVTPDTDLADLALLMADHNLATLPVVDPNDQLLGVITVDDVLPATLPSDWRLRDPAPRPEPNTPA